MKLLWISPLFWLQWVLVAQAQPASANSPILVAQAAVSESSSPQPSATPSALPADSTGEGPLASPASQLPSVEQLDQMFKQSSLGKAADEARLHAEWRDLSNRTGNEPDLVAARARAEAATTDLEKRKRLRLYYTAYFERLRARSSSQELKDFIDARKTEQIALLAQDRVRPGSTPAASALPVASPKRKQKKSRLAPEPSLPQQ